MAAKRRKPRKLTRKQSAAKLRIARRRAEVARLKVAGYSFRAIAERLGCNVATAYSDYTAILDELNRDAQETVEQKRDSQYEEVALIKQKLTPLLDDDDRAIGAAGALLKAHERVAKLFGLDAPDKFDHSGSLGVVSLEELDAMRRASEANEIPLGSPEDAKTSG